MGTIIFMHIISNYNVTIFFIAKIIKKFFNFILMVKIKDKKHHLAIAIKENLAHGMKPKEIAELFHLSKQRVNYWLHHIIKKRKRRTKLNRKEKKVSARNIQIKFNKLRNKFKEKKKKKIISLSTAIEY